jgi:signal transduction histidine kinase
MFPSQPTEDEQRHRRELTDYALKLMLLVAGLGLLLEAIFYLAVLSPRQQSAVPGLRLLITLTVLGGCFMLLLLVINRQRKVPYWIVPTVFLLSLVTLTLFVHTGRNLITGPTAVILMVPVLLAGVLICSYAAFAFSTAVVASFAIYGALHPEIAWTPSAIVFFYLFSCLIFMIFRRLDRSNDELRRAAAQSETILSALRGGYLLTDQHHRILRLNEKTSSFFPLARREANLLDAIQDPTIQISEEDRKCLMDVVSGVGPREVHVRVSDRDYFAANISIPSNREHLIFLREVTAELEIDRLKDTALAMVSHELRTPLSAIRGHAEMALREPDTAVSNATRILLNAQRLLIMVENLLSQSRLRTGKARNVPAPTNIETVFRIVYSLLASEAKEKGLVFAVKVDTNLPVLMVDAVLLQQILTNLVCNAIKFTCRGGVTMTATLPDSDHWSISVRDTGSGIPASKRSEIFKEFFQAEAGTVYDRSHQGTGLGLSIVKGFVDQMGGTLTLHSEEGEGSEFSVCFPLVIPKEITKKRIQSG